LEKVIGLVGPTAVGKTEVSVLLAKKIGAEIVSSDVMQSYRLFDIGTAKATKQEQQDIPHHMIDVFSPWENVNLSVYSEISHQTIEKILSRKKNVVLVGGSGLYSDSILYQSYSFSKTETDAEYRKKLMRLLDKNGNLFLYDELKKIDPQYAETTHPNNLKRVIRALEYHHASGNKMSEKKRDYVVRYRNTVIFGLYLNREKLYEQINRRVDAMIEKGLIEEVRSLMQAGLTLHQNAMQAIGYKEIYEALTGAYDIDTGIALVKQHSRNYAKRQYTWFKRNPNIQWIDVEQYASNQQIAEEMEKKIHNESK
jgi:tRNA dimethylallyltransferase